MILICTSLSQTEEQVYAGYVQKQLNPSPSLESIYGIYQKGNNGTICYLVFLKKQQTTS